MNKCKLIGIVATNPVYTHNFNGEDYYAMMIDVERTSKYVDRIHVFISSSKVNKFSDELLEIGSKVYLEGTLVNSNSNNHKDVSIVVNYIEPTDKHFLNEVRLSGVLSEIYDTKELPKYNKKVKIVILKQESESRNVTLKISAWNNYADLIENNYKIGDKATVICRLEGKHMKSEPGVILHEGSLVTLLNK